jgi:hypothetical protein
MTGNSVGRIPRVARNRAIGPVALVLLVLALHGSAFAADAALQLRAIPLGTASSGQPLSIELSRWSTDSERGPLLAALAPPAPAPPVSAAPPAAGRAGGRAAAAGRGGRGGRGGGGAAVQNPIERLTGAVKAAPTVGYIWGGVTGYSIRYAWHASAADGTERVVLITDRRLDAVAPPTAPPTAPSTADAPPAGEFTVIEMLIDPKGTGEAKTSLTTPVLVDATAQTLALDGYRAAPALLKVTR